MLFMLIKVSRKKKKKIVLITSFTILLSFTKQHHKNDTELSEEYKRDNLLNKELKSLVPVDTETNINLKIATQKTDVIHQSHNVIKDTITLT